MIEQVLGEKPDLIALAGEIAAAYVIRNHIATSELPGLILNLHAALAGLGSQTAAPNQKPAEAPKPTSAQIRKSITDDALISFIDGKAYKTLRRHIRKHGFEPSTYRERYGLTQDYPMTAQSYSKRRADIAKSRNFGSGYRVRNKE